MNGDGRNVDHRGMALVGFVVSRGDALELPECGQEMLDQMALFFEFPGRFERCLASRVSRDNDPCAALVLFLDDPMGVESFVGMSEGQRPALERLWI